MGYMGLEDYNDSDGAFDAAYSAIGAMVESLNNELDTNEGNEYNTCGIINVALFFEAFIIPYEEFYGIDSLNNLAIKTLKKTEKKIEVDSKKDWDSKSNKEMHLDAYNRMANSLRSFIEEE